MSKQTIAVDVDDVLAVHAEAMVAYSNRVFGTSLTINDYTEHWSAMWQVDHAETARRAEQYHKTNDMAEYRHHVDAEQVLRKLTEHYRLIVVTARRKEVSVLTEEWIKKYYDGIFDGIHFAGIWDTITADSATATKAAICHELGADYLIDDQSKHCNAVAGNGITAIMFGDYPWQSGAALSPGVVRCKTWQAVGEFFDAKTKR